MAMVVDGQGKLLGCVTDGDIRRAILGGVSLDSPVSMIMNASPRTLPESEADKALEMIRSMGVKQVPLLDEAGRVVGVKTWKEVFGLRTGDRRDNAVFIMAGGKGTRLAPLTRIIPKPLVPLGDKTVIEVIMDRFVRCGLDRFVLSVNYKAEMIRAYFEENKGYDVRFVQEAEYLGTAGSLRLGRQLLDKTFFLANCDVLADLDYDDILDSHRRSGDDVTMVGVLKNWKIPYGVIKLTDGKFSEVREKPEFDFIINGGIYVMEPHVVDLIGDGEAIDMPDLVRRVGTNGMNVGVYPVSREWTDIGEIDEYRRIFNEFSFIKE